MQLKSPFCCMECHDHPSRKHAQCPENPPQKAGLQQRVRDKGSNLPEYPERAEIEAVIAAAPNPMAQLLMLEQWRAGLLVSETLALEKRDLFLDSDRPTLHVRQGKGNKARAVTMHPELQTALIAATS